MARHTVPGRSPARRVPVSERHQYLLDESALPKAWYNINADMPVPPQPVLHPGTMEPVTPDFLSVLFPMSLIHPGGQRRAVHRDPRAGS